MYSVNAIYSTYQGEVNVKGIGAPVIFVRLQGCHLRCYKKTMGILCDTPEALQKKSDTATEMTAEQIIDEVSKISRSCGGIDLICLSGGDPLWRNPETVLNLFHGFQLNGYTVSVETSGTISMAPFAYMQGIYWVLDYKLKSAGVAHRFCYQDLPYLRKGDFVKFVVYDEQDLQQFLEVYPEVSKTRACLAIGLYWGAKITSSRLIQFLQEQSLLGKVHINLQAHKLLTLVDTKGVSDVEIPRKI